MFYMSLDATLFKNLCCYLFKKLNKKSLLKFLSLQKKLRQINDGAY